MLLELSIRNFAIIQELRISFDRGLSIITGETGAGKSIIIGALGLLLGGRAAPELIRTGEESATVEGLFDIGGREDISQTLSGSGHGLSDQLLIRRVISRAGKSRVYVNGSLSTAALLSGIGKSLISICGQYENQAMLERHNHCGLVDEFARLEDVRWEFRQLHGEFQSVTAQLADLEQANRNRAERGEFLRFQLREIEEAQSKPGEDAALAEEKVVIANAQRLSQWAAASYEALYSADESVLKGLRGAIANMKQIKGIDASAPVNSEELDNAFFMLEDVSYSMRDYIKKVQFNPERLDEIEARLELLGKLKRKYGGTLDSVAASALNMKRELEKMDSLDEEIARLEAKKSGLKKTVLERGRRLSEARKNAARKIEQAIESEVHQLKMADAKFSVVFHDLGRDDEGDPVFNENGLDDLEFFLSTNRGEELKPLNRIASGGELSRIMLAIKNILAGTGSSSTLIFDEVDSGIGGATAELIGEKLREVSRVHQVICITHLPQIASFGERHYLVSKGRAGKRTQTGVQALSPEERLDEIARMLGGTEVSKKTRDHAREMLRRAGERKSETRKRATANIEKSTNR